MATIHPNYLSTRQIISDYVSPQSKPSPFKLGDVPGINCDDQRLTAINMPL